MPDITIEIDRTTILPDAALGDLLTCQHPARTIVVPEIFVEAKQHKLTVLSSNEAEHAKYSDHTFRAPEMALEFLTDHYWFPQYGFLINKEGKCWRHSTLGQFGDPHFLTTYAVEKRPREDGDFDYYFHENLLSNAPIIEEPVFITSHYASHNYGHFMLDMVPLIHFAKAHGLQMISRPLLDWQKQIYSQIGIDINQVLVRTERAVFLKKVFVSNRHNAQSTYAASPHLREVFQDILQVIKSRLKPKRQKKRLFLSRGASQKRDINNRPMLEAMLKTRGFKTIFPEQLAFEEQALLFSQAEVIVSEFGAIMTNVVFCKEGTTVVEIIPEGQNDPWSRHLCASLNLEHITLFHQIKDEDREAIDIGGRSLNTIYYKFDADIAMIESVINQVLGEH